MEPWPLVIKGKTLVTKGKTLVTKGKDLGDQRETLGDQSKPNQLPAEPRKKRRRCCRLFLVFQYSKFKLDLQSLALTLTL